MKIEITTAFGAPGEDTMTLRVDLSVANEESENHNEFRACGRTLAWRPGRHAAVRLGEGVIIAAGGFHASGGSMRNPTLADLPGTILEVRDVPRSLAEAYAATSRGVTIVSQSAPTPAAPAARLATGQRAEQAARRRK